ncbi:response regulator transcription factor [Amycolatopsis suaedae]|uniref:Response regulator transcription factor n=1 Tax=Amycolatopsis suaedae TaxID=2510978 RepID=A0A4Q7J5Z1_9PSEU|nr:response regulator transcription factor [Amycolatopsis suaedae]
MVLAVDDEPHGLSELVHCLRGNPHIERILAANDATEALRFLGSEDAQVKERRDRGLPPVDAVFADLQMPGLSGMEMSRVFASLKPAPVLVFVTGHPEEAVDAFDLGAVDYVLKPCKQERLDKAIKRVLTQLQATAAPAAASGGAAQPKADDEVIAVELAGNTKLIPRASVRWVEAQGDYARLFTNEGSHLVRIPLAQLEERWEKAGFVRIHRSYLVALQLITELRMGQGGYQVVIGNEEKLLPVSRRHTRELKDRLVGSSRNG